MANTLKVVDMVLKEAQRIAHEKNQFIATTDLQYDSSFTYQANRGPNGQTLRIREPNMYTVRQGSRVMDVQDQNETTQNLTVATQSGVDMRFNSAELIQSVNSDGAFDALSKNYIEPAVSTLVSTLESNYIAYVTPRVYNVAGTAGTALNSLAGPNAARGYLNRGLAPKDGNRCIQADSLTMGTIVNGLSGLFQDSAQIKEQYREGMMGRTAMADWYENDRMWTLTNGSDIVCTLAASAAVTDGGSNITMASLSAAPATGAVFTIPGVYACHPETKQSLGVLQQFTILTPSTTTQEVSPKTYLTGARQNICSAASAQLATTFFDSTGNVPTFVGAASTSYIQPLMYHKEAFQFVTADLPIMDDAHKCQRTTKDGLSMRLWMGSDIRNDELLMRLDILHGFAALRPAWACRMIGSASA
jgi:hypothetical protein